MPNTCDRPIRDRQGEPLGFNCNLPKHHLGKCAEVLTSVSATWIDADGKPRVVTQSLVADAFDKESHLGPEPPQEGAR